MAHQQGVLELGSIALAGTCGQIKERR